jgi:hypothetical protein
MAPWRLHHTVHQLAASSRGKITLRRDPRQVRILLCGRRFPMRRLRFPCVLALSMLTSCAGQTPAPSSVDQGSATTPPPPRQQIDPATLKPTTSYTISFSALRDNKAPLATHVESGFTVAAVAGGWIALTTYGNPQPFIEFNAAPGTTVTGEVRVTADGAPFWLNSVDFYSSTTKIPYVVEGFLNGEPRFTVVDVIGNTFGAFARRPNPNADLVVDEVRLRLSNPAAPCCGNPMGIDNIAVSK